MKQVLWTWWPTLAAIAAVCLWWAASTIASIASKSVMREGRADKNNGTSSWTSAAFRDLRWIDLTAFQLLLGAVVSIMGLRAMKKSLWLENTGSGLRITIIVAAFGNVIGNLASNAAYALISSSTAQVVKACEPIFTFGLTILFYKDYSSLDLSTFLSVVMIVVGATAFIAGDATFNIWGIIAAVISSTAFPMFNVLMKKLSILWDSPLQKFAVMSIYSFTLLLPVLLLKMLVDLGIAITSPYESLTFAVFHNLSNLASITVLEVVNPVTHAVLNISKKLLVILANIAYFKTPFSVKMLTGLVVLLTGSLLYKMEQKSVKFTLFVFISSLLISALQYFHNYRLVLLG